MTECPSIVLVVDDDISVRESLEALLRHEGLDVETFVSAQEFLSRPPLLFQAAWYWTSLFPDSTVSICRSVLRWNGMRCQLSLSPAMAIFPSPCRR